MSEIARYGLCPVCDRDMQLKKDGTLRHHGGPVGSGMWPDYRAYRCDGVGQKPVHVAGEVRSMMTPSEAFDRVDALVDTNPLELRDLVWGVLGRIDALSGAESR